MFRGSPGTRLGTALLNSGHVTVQCACTIYGHTLGSFNWNVYFVVFLITIAFPAPTASTDVMSTNQFTVHAVQAGIQWIHVHT